MKKYRFKIRLLPVIFFMAVVFLVVRAHSYNINIDNMLNIPLKPDLTRWDVFCYVKADFIFGLTIYAAVSMGYLLLTRQMKLKKSIIYIPMLLYALSILISYVFSDYKELAWLGNAGQFEGSRTLLCYIFMLFYTINAIDEIRDVLVVIFTTAVGVLLACLIGLTQLLGHDFFLTDIANVLVTGGRDMKLSGEFQPGEVYQTVSNMNYVGMYLALIIPVLAFAIFFLAKKNNRQLLMSSGIYDRQRYAIISCISALLLLIILNIYGAHSVGSSLGAIASLAVLFLAMLDKKRLREILIFAFLAGVIAFLAFIYIEGKNDKKHTGHKQIEYIETGIDYVNMSIDGIELRFVYDRDYDEVYVVDEKDAYVASFYMESEEGVLQLDDIRFAGKLVYITLKDVNGNECLLVRVKDDDTVDFGFTFYEDGAKYYNPFGNEVSLSKVDSFGFDGHLYAGSGRAYIWSRTIPLVLERLLTGYGADTFMLIFPQNDYAGKYSAGVQLSLINDKPHNLYLDVVVGNGILGLISFLAIAVMAILYAFKTTKDNGLQKAVAAGIMGFLLAGMFNDGNVCIMPMYYGMLGMMISIGIINKKAV